MRRYCSNRLHFKFVQTKIFLTFALNSLIVAMQKDKKKKKVSVPWTKRSIMTNVARHDECQSSRIGSSNSGASFSAKRAIHFLPADGCAHVLFFPPPSRTKQTTCLLTKKYMPLFEAKFDEKNLPIYTHVRPVWLTCAYRALMWTHFITDAEV